VTPTRASGEPVEVFRARYADVDRARCDAEPHGFAKMVAVRGRVAGVHIVGAHAGDIVHTGVLAVKERLRVSSLASMTWIYPTLSEVLRKASQSKYEQLLERPGVQKVMGVLRKLKGQ
jgi:pyruvate/2-oxoglutarate dehydrogenase complex dihydrolipoamide dehydrogenase (E3) component